jgi:hypothetical protein
MTTTLTKMRGTVGTRTHEHNRSTAGGAKSARLINRNEQRQEPRTRKDTTPVVVSWCRRVWSRRMGGWHKGRTAEVLNSLDEAGKSNLSRVGVTVRVGLVEAICRERTQIDSRGRRNEIRKQPTRKTTQRARAIDEQGTTRGRAESTLPCECRIRRGSALLRAASKQTTHTSSAALRSESRAHWCRAPPPSGCSTERSPCRSPCPIANKDSTSVQFVKPVRAGPVRSVSGRQSARLVE